MDTAEPPKIVLERPAACSDAERAEAILNSALASARAPRAAWSVTMRVDAAPGGGLLARGEIVDHAGSPVAHRDLSGTGTACAGLARAVAVWASLVLDAERERAASTSPPAAKPAPAAPPTDAKEAAVTAWPAPVVNEPAPPEHDWYLHHEERRTLEPGLATFLMTGAGTTTAILGASPYFVVEAANGVFLRPSLAAGESVLPLAGSSDARAVLAAARFDTCLRLPGMYAQRRGIQLDLCGGADLGFVRLGSAGSSPGVAGVPVSDRTLPHVAVGPSLDLRGELGGDFAVTLRGVGGFNVVRDSYEDASGATISPPAWSLRIELALSWRIR